MRKLAGGGAPSPTTVIRGLASLISLCGAVYDVHIFAHIRRNRVIGFLPVPGASKSSPESEIVGLVENLDGIYIAG